MGAGPRLVSCPTCGRTRIDLIGLAGRVEEASGLREGHHRGGDGLRRQRPREAREADIGVAGGVGEGLLFKKGQILRKVPEDQLLPALLEEIENCNKIGEWKA